MKEQFELKIALPVSPEKVYSTWLSSEGHTAMTGSEAHCSDRVGDYFNAWEGYIEGRNLELLENQRILQSWRSSEFSEEDEDSLLEIELSAIPEGCELKLKHSNIPEGQTLYIQGWEEYYFQPMLQYFLSHIP
ncbi:MAG: SRPBCC domain-containing protein [Bacteroidota bacterium]|nr:SRPBCC domain-containing protein [Bacteroidota bacterium]MDX5430720.1 SRPBCC domain-containing protein [Bacteroidota bacterium]MDX5469467.1 SRPBCC domain-containing protein [Bacteroidota bacterium]